MPDPVPDYLADLDRGVARMRIGYDERYATEGVAPALVTAIAYGTAAVQLPGSVMPRPSDLNLDAVEITDKPDLDRALT